MHLCIVHTFTHMHTPYTHALSHTHTQHTNTHICLKHKFPSHTHAIHTLVSTCAQQMQTHMQHVYSHTYKCLLIHPAVAFFNQKLHYCHVAIPHCNMRCRNTFLHVKGSSCVTLHYIWIVYTTVCYVMDGRCVLLYTCK